MSRTGLIALGIAFGCFACDRDRDEDNENKAAEESVSQMQIETGAPNTNASEDTSERRVQTPAEISPPSDAGGANGDSATIEVSSPGGALSEEQDDSRGEDVHAESMTDDEVTPTQTGGSDFDEESPANHLSGSDTGRNRTPPIAGQEGVEEPSGVSIQEEGANDDPLPVSDFECPPWVPPPGLNGPTDAGVELATARKWLRFRALREQERMWQEYRPAQIAAQYRIEHALLDHECLTLADTVDLGRGIFLRQFTPREGFGNDLANIRGTAAGSKLRPNLRRIQKRHFGGPDATACVDCHWKGGFAGAGDRADNSYLFGDGDRPASADVRNPPALWGLGWVQLIASEMSADLAQLRQEGLRAFQITGQPQRVTLETKGIDFGFLTIDESGVNTRHIQGIDPDLVVKPFGWKGNFPTLRDFVAHSFHIHHSLQSDHILRDPGPTNLGEGSDPDDPDADGVFRELTDGQLTAVVAFLATMDVPGIQLQDEGVLPSLDPFAEPTLTATEEYTQRWADGSVLFDELGCAHCHAPFMTVQSPVFETVPTSDGAPYLIDLSRESASPRPGYDTALQRWLVPVFSDFKRHAMGAPLAGQHEDRDVPTDTYITRRLMGVSQTGPYLHDGSAVTFDGAIARHGGEAAPSRNAFLQLEEFERAALRVFLLSLRRMPSIRVR